MAIKTRIPNAFITITQKVMAPFEDLTGLERPEWRDYSRYDLDIDLDVAYANGVSGAAFRYAMGWSGVDDTFNGRWSQAGDIDYFYRTGYSVLYPSLDLERQVDHWFDLFPKIDIIPRILDAELQDGQTDGKVGEAIWKTWKMIEAYDGVAPVLYSRYLLIDKWLRWWPQEDLDKLLVWGARYLFDRTREHPGPPYGTMNYVKIPAENWILHQTADKKAPYPGETERSTIVDYDRWELGNEDQMHQWIQEKWGNQEPPPHPVDPELENRVLVLETQMEVVQDDIAQIQSWITLHDGEPSITMKVQANENFALAVPVGHDSKGKPILEPPNDETRITVSNGDIITVKMYASYSDADDPQTPIIYATGRVEYYIVASDQNGAGQFVRKSKVEPVS